MSSHKEITDVPLGQFVGSSMKTYGNYVLQERALCDFRDGLKPVQRRVLWAMYYDEGAVPNGGFKKSAKLVGTAMGSYHPHGDAAIYGALVGLRHERYPLVEEHGNFGDLVDAPSAMRYTEAKLSKLSMTLFDAIDVGQMITNYSGDKNEPLVLPSRLPLMLLNGSEGIGVGLASCIPSHNIEEVVEACRAIITSKKKLQAKDLVKFIKGPDYLYGGELISPQSDIEQIYENGSGSLRFQCKFKIEKAEDHQALVISAEDNCPFPPYFNPASFIEKITKLMDQGLVEYVEDETSEENGYRIVVGFTNGNIFRERILPLLRTSAKYEFWVNKRNSEDDIEVNSCNLSTMLYDWLDFRRDVETKLLKLRKKQAEEKLDREETKLLAIDNIDTILPIIQDRKMTNEQVVEKIMKVLKITKEQVEIILDLNLRALMRANRQAQMDKIAEIKSLVKSIIKDLSDVDGVLLWQLDELKPFFDKRRTALNLGAEEETVAVASEAMYIFANRNGDVWKAKELPLKGKGFGADFVTKTKLGVTIVGEDGNTQQVSLSYLSDGKQGVKNIVGLVAHEKEWMICIDQNGTGTCIANPQKTDNYYFMKDADKIQKVISVDKGDQVWAYKSDGSVSEVWKYDDLPGKNRNSKGFQWLPKHTKNVELLVNIKGNSVINPVNNRPFDIDTFCKAEEFLVVGADNLVLTKDGTKSQMTKAEIIKALSSGEKIKEVYVL